MIYQTRQQQRAQEQMERLMGKVAVVLIIAGVIGMWWIFNS